MAGITLPAPQNTTPTTPLMGGTGGALYQGIMGGYQQPSTSGFPWQQVPGNPTAGMPARSAINDLFNSSKDIANTNNAVNFGRDYAQKANDLNFNQTQSMLSNALGYGQVGLGQQQNALSNNQNQFQTNLQTLGLVGSLFQPYLNGGY